jgi:adenine deaminase
MNLQLLQRRIRVALGHEPADLVLAGGQVVNVFTTGVEQANVAVCDGVIAAVGPGPWTARETVDATGKFILPGFIDSHMHLESTMLMPAELARLVLPLGTTATISDSHEIGNVLGVPGIEMLLRASADIPFNLYFMASSCVPCTSWEHAGARLGPAEVAALLERPRVLGLAEMMDFPAVLAGDETVLAKIAAALARQRPVDGHAPRLAGRDLLAYASAGIRSDHESETAVEARAKAGLGMLVQIREGSLAHNLDAILPLVVAKELGDFWTLVTDDILPTDLLKHGHLNGLLRQVVAAGVNPADAVRHVTLVPARHYGLHDRGAVAPGYAADLVLTNDLRDFQVDQVYKDGRLAARQGACVADLPPATIAAQNSVHIREVSEKVFGLRLSGSVCPVIRIVPGQLVNRVEQVTVAVRAGYWSWDPRQDVALIASIERHRASGQTGLGLVSGFTFHKAGAIGSSVAHDSHNLVIAGTNGRDMTICARALAECGGGFIAVSEGAVRAIVPLPIAGLLSTQSALVVRDQLDQAHRAAADLGVAIENPFGVLSFLALPVIPELRITDQGLWNVVEQRFVSL